MENPTNKIRHYRTKANLTQKSLAVACGWSDSNVRIRNYESSIRNITIKNGYKIVTALNNAGVKCEFCDVFPPEPMMMAS
jgi:transcriptional regulator with XRE-family HTH domain